jgi:DNA polymerase III subunit delta
MIISLSGNNVLQLRAEYNRLLADFVGQYGDMAVEKIDCEEVEYPKITEALQSLPFLTSKKLVVLNRPGTQKEFVENFESLVESISDSTDVIVVEPKPDKRSSYYKLLQKKTEFQQFDELAPQELPKWLHEQAKKRGGSLSIGDASYLVDRIGANQQLLESELKKLLTYAPSVTRKTIELLTEPTPQSTIFQLLDAVFANNLKRVFSLYKEQRALKVEPAQIVAMLAWQLHVLAIVKFGSEHKKPQDIAKEAGINPFVVQKSQNIARKLSQAELKKMIKDLYELDIKMKTTSVDPDEALQQFLISISA